MIEILLLVSIAGNILLVVLLHLQQRDATAMTERWALKAKEASKESLEMAERLANRALASEKTWDPLKEPDAEPQETYVPLTDAEEYAQEKAGHDEIVRRFKVAEGEEPIPMGMRE